MAIGLVDRFRSKAAVRRPSVATVVSGILFLAGAAAASAQEQPAQTSAPADVGGLQEVVVTAERRSENIQSVPIAITAFTAEALWTST